MERAKYRVDFQDEEASNYSFEVLEIEMIDAVNEGYHGSCMIAVPLDREWPEMSWGKASIHIEKGGRVKIFPVICHRLISHERCDHYRHFTLHFSDPLFSLGVARGSEIFQNLKCDEIVSKILQRYNIANIDWRLDVTLFKRDYCVQYEETHLNFIRRLLQEEGINYVWHSDDDGSQLVFFRGKRAHPNIDAPIVWPYKKRRDATQSLDPYIENLCYRQEACLSALNHRYFDPKRQSIFPNFDTKSHDRRAFDPIDVEYIHHGRQDFRKKLNPDQSFDNWGQRRCEQELNSARALSRQISGESRNLCVEAGKCFQFFGHDDVSSNETFLPIKVKYHGRQASVLGSSMAEGDKNFFELSFEAVFAGAPLHPWKRNPPRRVQGLHSARVWGPPGHAGCYHDEMQRVIVRFDWDYAGPGEAHLPPSRWIGCSQPNAGNQDGSNNTPDIGSIVYVAYQNGDPEQPVIVGAHHDARRVAARAESAIARMEQKGSPFADIADIDTSPSLSPEEQEARELEEFFAGDK